MGSASPSRTMAATMAVGGDLNSYLTRIRDYPMLEAEEEQRLSRAWRDQGDEASMHKLVNSHLRLVAKIAMKFRGYGLPVGELISEGNVGMMQAVNRFDPDRGFRLSTYAMWWIRASIQEYILHSWSLVKIGTTASQKKLFFNLRKLKAKLEAFDEGDLKPEHVQEIAATLGVAETDVISMNGRLASHDQSLNAPLREEGEGEWQDWLVDDRIDQEQEYAHREEYAERRDMLGSAMSSLNDRERRILVERRISEDPKTLQDLSEDFGISRERVRQIEARALEKVEKSIKSTLSSRRLAASPEQTAGTL